jgi:hypothetical protein
VAVRLDSGGIARSRLINGGNGSPEPAVEMAKGRE